MLALLPRPSSHTPTPHTPELAQQRAINATLTEQLNALKDRLSRFDKAYPGIIEPVQPASVPSLSRCLLLVASRNLTELLFLTDCLQAVHDMLTPDMPVATHLAEPDNRALLIKVSTQWASLEPSSSHSTELPLWQIFHVHSDQPSIAALLCRIIRRLVSLEPQTIGSHY